MRIHIYHYNKVGNYYSINNYSKRKDFAHKGVHIHLNETDYGNSFEYSVKETTTFKSFTIDVHDKQLINMICSPDLEIHKLGVAMYFNSKENEKT